MGQVAKGTEMRNMAKQDPEICPIYRTSVLYLGQVSDLVLAVFRISTPLGTYLIVFLGTNCI